MLCSQKTLSVRLGSSRLWHVVLGPITNQISLIIIGCPLSNWPSHVVTQAINNLLWVELIHLEVAGYKREQKSILIIEGSSRSLVYHSSAESSSGSLTATVAHSFATDRK